MTIVGVFFLVFCLDKKIAEIFIAFIRHANIEFVLHRSIKAVNDEKIYTKIKDFKNLILLEE